MRNTFIIALCSCVFMETADAGDITRVWLSHKSNDPSKLVVNWETPEPGNSIVQFVASTTELETIEVAESVTLHHVEIPLKKNTTYRYVVRTNGDSSDEATFKAYPTYEMRVAVVADWQGRPKLDGILTDDVHLLLTCGDNIGSLHGRCGEGVVDCIKPYGELIDAYPQLFSSTPFLPALGNHDREIRPRGPMPPAEPVYDVEATAFRKFFELPDDEWKWRFDVPQFNVRFVALDLNHIQDLGTTWQTCHPFDKSSEQFRWYEKLMTDDKPRRVVTLHNEKSGSMRGKESGAWHDLFRRGTCTITGFGYFAERAEVDGHPYYNTALGAGAKYPDANSKFFAAEASYVLLTFTKDAMKVELKALDGRVLDAKALD
jgi:hypothetical protein